MTSRMMFLALVGLTILLCSTAGWLGYKRFTRPVSAATEPHEAFGKKQPLPGATHYVQSADFNPHSTLLDDIELSELQAIIDSTNAELDTLQSQIVPIANAWARLRVENDMFYLVEPSDTVRKGADTITVRITGGGVTKDVYIKAGECAELDVLMDEVEQLLDRGRERIRLFISKLEAAAKTS